jgi:tetratricopeptide (TPR) repeat protein
LLGHHARLRFLLVWASVDAAKHPDHLAAAVELLGELREQFPHALEVVEVLFLAFLQQNAPHEVEREMAALSRLHVELPYEIECRMGRVFRQRGTKAWPAGQPMPPGTADDFRRSLQVYERAWQQSQHYYPGGNVAGLKLLLGEAKKAREIADRVLAVAREAPADDLWARIAQADMLYLLGRDDEAERQYRDTLPLCPPQSLESSLRQLDLLLRVEPNRRASWDQAKLIALFGHDAFAKL